MIFNFYNLFTDMYIGYSLYLCDQIDKIVTSKMFARSRRERDIASRYIDYLYKMDLFSRNIPLPCIYVYVYVGASAFG